MPTPSVTASLLQDTLKGLGPGSWFWKQWPLAGSYGLLEAEPKVFHTPVDALPVLQFLLGRQGLPPSQQIPQALVAGVGGKQSPSCCGFDLGGCVPVAMRIGMAVTKSTHRGGSAQSPASWVSGKTDYFPPICHCSIGDLDRVTPVVLAQGLAKALHHMASRMKITAGVDKPAWDCALALSLPSRVSVSESVDSLHLSPRL